MHKKDEAVHKSSNVIVTAASSLNFVSVDVLIGEALALVCTQNDVHIIAVMQVKCKCMVEVLELEVLSSVSLSLCSCLH